MDWNERYREADFVYGTVPNDFLAEVVEQIPQGTVLSLAEGEGRNAVYLARLGYQVTGVDASEVGLAKASQLAAAAQVTITTVAADLQQYDIGVARWDGIIACFCHLPPGLRKQVHTAVVQGLKPGGVFVLEAYSKEQLAYGSGGPQSLEMLMDLDELKQELAGLVFRHAVTREREVHEGIGHTGLASVIQIVGVKP